ncbi:MAG: hypothetical protein INR71_03090 [Terriglobus roseus]|nr:hypothetical protein [Terriglobus roseus]
MVDSPTASSSPMHAAFLRGTASGSTPGSIGPPWHPVHHNHQQQQQQQPPPTSHPSAAAPSAGPKSTFRCPRCTFENHPSLLSCEICGASLVSAPDKRLDLHPGRSESPGPTLDALSLQDGAVESVKFSFRGGGEKIFHERLKSALVQRKWLLQSAPPVPNPAVGANGSAPSEPQSSIGGSILDKNKVVGIAGLERRGQELRKNNELIIGNAFEDLEALMTSAKEVIALAERFSSQAAVGGGGAARSETDAVLSQSASALGLVTTKDMLSSGSDELYVSELSRNLAEYLTDDRRGVLRKEGGIISLVDLWAVFNRARGGVELISPADFEKAAQLWDKLRLPVRLRRFKSGLLVVQGRERTDEKTVAGLVAWLQTTHFTDDMGTAPWDQRTYGRGVSAHEVAEHFGWSLGVASEELEMAEELGALCREQGLDGIRFWENWLTRMDPINLGH